VYLTVAFRLEHEDAETATYEEQVEGAEPPVIGTISLAKSALSSPPPPVMRITVTYAEARLAPSEHAGFTPWLRGASGETLEAGDKVVVVKNRLGRLASPPEWLEQYLGKTGTVLYTTASGAMLEVDGRATWFAYEELERKDPEIP
jgi:hypothetical protein